MKEWICASYLSGRVGLWKKHGGQKQTRPTYCGEEIEAKAK
jgi:hypothetical protein